tara:strand:- start:18178 stop:19185 length:1008 start_codon:yes stop_codon:yes gene_type:complete
MNDYKNIVLTGGAGFIGSHIVDGLVNKFPNALVKIIDKFTYAGDKENLKNTLSHQNISLVVGDICDWDFILAELVGADLVIHAAAESHVDRSFSNSPIFMQTNIIGSQFVLEASRLNNVKRLIHISTDEVYGTIYKGYATEEQSLNPTNPYAASKAAADMLIRTNIYAYKQPVIVVRPNNIYGTRQYPEKLLPKFILCLMNGMPLPIHGSGTQRRTFLSIQDLVQAILLLISKGVDGEVYNIGTNEEYSVLEISAMLCEAFGKRPETHLQHVKDRPFNDIRYGVNTKKLVTLGWKSSTSLKNSLDEIIQWHHEHKDRLMKKVLLDADYKKLSVVL